MDGPLGNMLPGPYGLSAPAAATAAAGTAVSALPRPGSTFFCEVCGKHAQFLGVPRAVRAASVSRSTIYYWMDRGWIHWRLLPSGRRVICLESLSRSAHSGRAPSTGENLLRRSASASSEEA